MTDNANQYRMALRAPVRALWKGVFDYDQAFAGVEDAIRVYFPRAWNEGAKECGVLPSELTPEERTAQRTATFKEYGFIDGLLTAVERGSPAWYDKPPHNLEEPEGGGKLAPLFSRVERWVGRYNDLRNQAKLMACKDQKLEWVLGRQVKKHCNSCIKLAGVIKRASYWQKHDVRPQHPTKLECMISAGGVSVCGCEFRKTDLHCTPGPLPKLP